MYKIRVGAMKVPAASPPQNCVLIASSCSQAENRGHLTLMMSHIVPPGLYDMLNIMCHMAN